MHRIVYAGAALLTSDEVASAVLAYAASLARAGTADTIVVPGIDDEGRPTELELLVGPASQMTSEPVAAPFEMDAADFLADLAERAARHTPSPRFPDDPDLRFYDPL